MLYIYNFITDILLLHFYYGYKCKMHAIGNMFVKNIDLLSS